MALPLPHVTFRLPAAELERLQTVASSAGIPRSQLIRVCLLALLKPEGKWHRYVNEIREAHDRRRRRGA